MSVDKAFLDFAVLSQSFLVELHSRFVCSAYLLIGQRLRVQRLEVRSAVLSSKLTNRYVELAAQLFFHFCFVLC